MSKRQKVQQSSARRNAPRSQQTASSALSDTQDVQGSRVQRPTVSLCTVTYNRASFLPLLQRQILAQTYPRSLMEWVIVDDSDDGRPKFEPDQRQGLTINHKLLDKRLPLGAKRNLSHGLCHGDIIVYLDDDDFYPPTRVAHAVERLICGDSLIAGSTILPILFLPERELWIAGPYGSNHATAGTFAFKRDLLQQASYDEKEECAEEKFFLKDYSIPMVQLDPNHTILCIGHNRNTYEKRNLVQAGKNPLFRKANQQTTEYLLAQLMDLLPCYESLLAPSNQDHKSLLEWQSPAVSCGPAQVTGQLLNRRDAPVAPTSIRRAMGKQETEVVNLCIVSHPGDIFSLCFLDVARYLRYRLHLLGDIREIRLSKNRLCKNAINIILGAHVGFDVESYQQYKCIFVNLEQLGRGGNNVHPEYIELLQKSDVIDYNTTNLAHYRQADLDDVAILSFGYAPYLQTASSATAHPRPLKEREIDLLFYGSINESRLHLLRRLASCGSEVKVLDNLFGPERDEVIQNAKLVLNLSYYEKGTFEQVRAFHCLSLGTPILSILSDRTNNIPPQFLDSVFFMNPDDACCFLKTQFKTDTFYSEAQSRLLAFRDSPLDSIDAEQAQLRRLLEKVNARPCFHNSSDLRRINLGSGIKYMHGWINIDIDKSACPDLVLDLCQELSFPLLAHSQYIGPLIISEHSIEHIYADNVLEHVANLPRLMSNCLRMLRVGGQIEIIVPYEKSQAAWQDPMHVRAFNEKSWIYFTQWSWRLGWFEHHFKLESFSYLDAHAKATLNNSNDAFFMRVLMTKEKVDLKTKNQYRLDQPDFGPGLDDFSDEFKSC